MSMSKRKREPKLRTDEAPLAAASRRLRRLHRKPRWTLMDAVLCPPSGTLLRLVANAVRSAEGAGRN